MARAQETTDRQPGLIVRRKQAVIALPMEDGGTALFDGAEAANAVRTDATLERALAQIGAWRDLADQDVEGELDRLRHEAPPSEPLAR